MREYKTWEYLGTEFRSDVYSLGIHTHGFYNPHFDKIWCFYSENDYADLSPGTLVDITAYCGFSLNLLEDVIKVSNKNYVGVSCKRFVKMLPELQLKYKKENATTSINEKNEEIWIF